AVGQAGAGDADDFYVAGIAVDQALQAAAIQGAAGGHQGDATAAAQCSGGFDGRFDGDDGNAQRGAQGLGRYQGGGVAGDNQCFAALVDQQLCHALGALDDPFWRAVPVRGAL